MPIPPIVKSVKGLKMKSVQKANCWSRLVNDIMLRKAKHVWLHIGKHIKGNKVLDVGMGSGSTLSLLKAKGLEVIGIDVDDLSIYDDLKPIIYNGHKIPFKDKNFDTAIIIHVLHHCNDGLEILREAKRVSKRVIFIEDTYRNIFELIIDAVFDSLGNFEFWLHKYRKVSEWRNIIKGNRWKVIAFDEWTEMGIVTIYGRYCMFVIE